MMRLDVLLGLAGMFLILLAFTLNVFRRIDSHSMEFLLMNLTGSILLGWYAVIIMSTPFLILNAFWSVVAIWGLLHHFARSEESHGQ